MDGIQNDAASRSLPGVSAVHSCVVICMGLTFLSPLISGGAVLIAVPIVLHLVMRQVPKRLIFPAVRFLQLREQANRRQLRLRHLLLLLLRCAAIVFLAAALARPSIKTSGRWGAKKAPVAAALIFDTSPRMEYREENRTRLQAAEETARWLLTQLPPESDVAVLTSEEPTGDFSVDLGGGRAADRKAQDGRQHHAAGPDDRPFDSAAQQEGPRRARRSTSSPIWPAGAWPADPNHQLKSLLETAGDIGIYVVDVGIANPRDFALGRREDQSRGHRQERQSANSRPMRSASGRTKTAKSPCMCSTRKPRRPRRSFAARNRSAGGPARPSRSSSPWPTKRLGTHQGFVRITGEDNLAADDIRYFTFDVRPPFKRARRRAAAGSTTTRCSSPRRSRRSHFARAAGRGSSAIRCRSTSCSTRISTTTRRSACSIRRARAGRLAAAAFLCRRRRRPRNLAGTQRAGRRRLQRRPRRQTVLPGKLARIVVAGKKRVFLAPRPDELQHPRDGPVPPARRGAFLGTRSPSGGIGAWPTRIRRRSR